MNRLFRWLGFGALATALAIAIYATVWFLTVTPHNIDQCYASIRNFGWPDRHGYRMYYGCDQAAREGMEKNDITSFKFAGLYSGIVDKDAIKAREYLYHAIRLGDNRSKIDLYIILKNIGPFPCQEKIDLLTSYKPEDQRRKEDKEDDLTLLKRQGCYKGPIEESQGHPRDAI